MAEIITIDPTGDNITGIFTYYGGLLFDFTSYQEKKWTWHHNFISSFVKERKPRLVIYEDNIRIKTSKGFINDHYRNLLKSIGGIELILETQQIPSKIIYSSFTKYAEREAEKGNIGGLVRIKKPREEGKETRGAKKKAWVFKRQEIDEHQKDALLLFWIYWTRMEKKIWPWINNSYN